MKIAVLGTRGIPANYSGLEECVEATAERLVARGHEVTVYCRVREGSAQQAEYRGARLVWLPIVATKHGETIVHTAMSVAHLARTATRDTVVHMYGVGNAVFLPLLRRLGYRSLVISVDGADWRRRKWGQLASRYLEACTRVAATHADFCVADSRIVEQYYRERFNTPNLRYIPYGFNPQPAPGGEDVFRRLGVKRGEYLLFVGRVVPEKGVHYLLSALSQVSTTHKLLVVGATQDAQYAESLRAAAPENVLFTGPIYGDETVQLYREAYLYVHPSDVDGTSHALLSAMGHGRPVLTSDIPENLETVGGTGFSFRSGDVADLAARLQLLLGQPTLLRAAGQAAAARVQSVYNWETVTDAYLTLYRGAAAER